MTTASTGSDQPRLSNTTPPTAATYGWGTVLLISAVMVGLYVAGLLYFYPEYLWSWNQYDDAYITYRYAANLASGHGLVFNSYERVNSASSLLYTLMLAAGYRAGITGLEQLATIINLVSAFGLITLLTRLCLRSSGSILITAAIVAPLSMCGALACWAVSGMETVLFAFLAMFLLYAAFDARSVLLSALLAAACVLTRPEGILLPMAMLVAGVINWTWFNRRPDRLWVTTLVAATAACCAYLLFNSLYYGEPLPHSLRFKQIASYYAVGGVMQLLALDSFLWNYYPVLLVFGIGLILPLARQLAVKDRHAPDALELTAIIYVLGSLAACVLGPQSDDQRYVVHLLPILAVCAAATLHRCRTLIVADRRWFNAGLAVILLFGCGRALLHQRSASRDFAKLSDHQRARKELGDWIAANLDSDQMILSADLGALAYRALHHQFIDVLGLTTSWPVDAAEHGRWDQLMTRLQHLQPGYAADTVYNDDRIYALSILEQPARYFHLQGPQLPHPLPFLQTPLTEIPGGNLRYRLSHLRWLDPDAPNSSQTDAPAQPAPKAP